MSGNAYKPGQSVRFAVAIAQGGVPTDAAALTLTVSGPSGAGTPTVITVNAPTHDGTGLYHADVLLPSNAAAGFWTARWAATGAAVDQNGLVETQFIVRALNF